jgi:predicted RNase H-like nuclease (RuvC/YqgF family)
VLVLNIEKERTEANNKFKSILEENQKMKSEIELLKQTNASIEEELRNTKEMILLLENKNSKLSDSSEQSNKMIDLLHQANEKIIQLSEKSKQEADKKIRTLRKENRYMKQRMDWIERALEKSNKFADDELGGTGLKQVDPENDEV